MALLQDAIPHDDLRMVLANQPNQGKIITVGITIRDEQGDIYRCVHERLTWLPLRESDWMKMDGWPKTWTIRAPNEDYIDWDIWDWRESKWIQILDRNPLLACAKAWAKTQEAQDAIQ